MSKAKDRARAIAGNPHRSTNAPLTARIYVCAHCHKLGQLVRVDNFYFHPDCPKRAVRFPKVKPREDVKHEGDT